MRREQITSIGRPIDLDYASNRAIAGLTLVVMVGGVLARLLTGEAWLASGLWGLQAGVAVFLAWAVGREVDPDHPNAAFVAAGLALVALWVWGLPELTVLFWLLILMRVVNRTAGPPAGVLDGLGLLGLGTWLSVQRDWGYGALTAMAFILDSQLPQGVRRHLVFGLVAVVVTAAIAVVIGRPLGAEGLSVAGALMAGALCLAFLPVIAAADQVESVGDQTGEPLRPVRVQTAQILALAVGVETTLLAGATAVSNLAPLWAAALGAALTWVYQMLSP